MLLQALSNFSFSPDSTLKRGDTIEAVGMSERLSDLLISHKATTHAAGRQMQVLLTSELSHYRLT